MSVIHFNTPSSPYYSGSTVSYSYELDPENSIADRFALENRANQSTLSYLRPGTVFSNNPVTGGTSDEQRALHQAARNYSTFGSVTPPSVWVPTAPRYNVNRDYGYTTSDLMREQNIARNTGYLSGVAYSSFGVSPLIPSRDAAMDRIATGRTDDRGYNSPASDIYYALAGLDPPRRNSNFFVMDQSDPTSPFSNTRYNMLGGMETISRSDPRHTAAAYADRSPELYNAYTSGAINGRSLFTRAMSDWVTNDRDEIGNTNFNFSAPPTIKFSFSGSGGGSISGTGIRFPGLSGKRFW